MNGPITIVLPVYGRAELLEEALDSVYGQSDPNWRLLIADDGSDSTTVALIERQLDDPRVQVVRRSRNLGLFANLNQAHREARTGWQLILCSDDRLESHALATLRACAASHPSCGLVLSSYRSIDAAGNARFDVNGYHYDQFAPSTREFAAGALLEPLLRFGSINGNITGMLVRTALFELTGPWRADWSQAADWEWLVRATLATPVLVQRQPIAQVRVHAGQLSVSNRKLQREGEEILQVLASLLNQPALAALPQRHRWAAYHAQFLLWNALKAAPRVGLSATLRQLALIQRSVGLRRTSWAMLASVPRRFQIRGTDRPLPPPAR
jgi:hypothetical protein